MNIILICRQTPKHSTYQRFDPQRKFQKIKNLTIFAHFEYHIQLDIEPVAGQTRIYYCQNKKYIVSDTLDFLKTSCYKHFTTNKHRFDLSANPNIRYTSVSIPSGNFRKIENMVIFAHFEYHIQLDIIETVANQTRIYYR